MRLLIRVHGQSSQAESESACQQQSRIQRFGAAAITEQIPQHHQQRIARLHPSAQFGDGSASVPGLFPLHQHGTIRQTHPSGFERPPQGIIGPAIKNLQVRQAAEQLTAEGEAAAEEAAAVVDEGEWHHRSLSCFTCSLRPCC